VSDPKNPILVEAGRRGAQKRWGPPGTQAVYIGDMSVPQRRLVLALVEAVREEAPAPAKADAQEVRSVSATSTPTRAV